MFPVSPSVQRPSVVAAPPPRQTWSRPMVSRALVSRAMMSRLAAHRVIDRWNRWICQTCPPPFSARITNPWATLMDKFEISPDGSGTAINMALFPPAWKPDAKHRSLTGTELESGYFPVEDTARLVSRFRSSHHLRHTRLRDSPNGKGDRAAAQGVQAAQGSAERGGVGDLASSASPNQAGVLWCLQAAGICRRTRHPPLWPATCGGCHLPRVQRLAAPQSSRE